MTDTIKRKVTPEQAMELVRTCIGDLPHGYRISQSSGWLRVYPGFKDSDRWDRPGIEFRLDLPKRAADRRSSTTDELLLEIRVQVDLPSFLESNIMITGLIRDMQLYSRLWFNVGELAQNLEICSS